MEEHAHKMNVLTVIGEKKHIQIRNYKKKRSVL